MEWKHQIKSSADITTKISHKIQLFYDEIIDQKSIDSGGLLSVKMNEWMPNGKW